MVPPPRAAAGTDPADAEFKSNQTRAMQLVTSMHVYMADFDDFLPHDFTSTGVRAAMVPYVREDWPFYSESDTPWEYVEKMGGRSPTQIEFVAQTPLFHTTPMEGWPRTVAFADAAVREVPEQDWEVYQWAIDALPPSRRMLEESPELVSGEYLKADEATRRLRERLGW